MPPLMYVLWLNFSIYILCVNANAINMTQSNSVEIGSHTIEGALIEL